MREERSGEDRRVGREEEGTGEERGGDGRGEKERRGEQVMREERRDSAEEEEKRAADKVAFNKARHCARVNSAPPIPSPSLKITQRVDGRVAPLDACQS